jgi:predicted dehydrogenase
MKVVLNNIRNGEILVEDTPCPQPIDGSVLIQTVASLISSGTEGMMIDFGKGSYLHKALSQPDKVSEVLAKASTDGVGATYDAVKTKLDQPLALGYCNVGVVLDGADTGFKCGSRVVSNGGHAEVVRAPKNLVAVVPDEVDDQTAAFTVLGAVGLQGVRLVNPTLGETVVVIGLGLIGLLTVQILKANGCRVLGIDIDGSKCQLAKKFGAEVVDLSKDHDSVAAAHAYSRGNGVDAVLITASSKSNDVVKQAATMCRKRGRIVLVGVVGLDLNRADFYEKELSFQVSCSYGPGRYDENYETRGNDYPIGFVRWTEQRNFEAILDLMAMGSIDVRPLIDKRFSIDDAGSAYEALANRSSLGIILEYPSFAARTVTKRAVQLSEARSYQNRSGNIAVLGGGNYSSRVLIPAFRRAGANLLTLVTSGGISAVRHGKKNGFIIASTDIEHALAEEIDTVVIATQHNLHASQTVQALQRGKHVFVEKPLALTHDQIDEIQAALTNSNSMLMVGYNRRFSPHIQKIKGLLAATTSPKTFIMTMNAGEIAKSHWTQDPALGGGRIIGEACHYIDLMRFLAGAKIKSFNAMKIGESDHFEITEDKASISLAFEDGSMGVIHYFANGGKLFPKERVEIFCGNAVLQLDNFKTLRGFGWKGFKRMKLWSQDKGQQNCVNAFMASVRRGSESPIPKDEILEVARTSIDVAEILRS